MYRCPNCGHTMETGVPEYVYRRCDCCGYEFMPTPYDANKMYSQMRHDKAMWRLLFVLLELSSFFVALGLCWLFAQALDTDVFARHNYLIFAVWAWVAYKIYQKLRPRIA